MSREEVKKSTARILTGGGTVTQATRLGGGVFVLWQVIEGLYYHFGYVPAPWVYDGYLWLASGGLLWAFNHLRKYGKDCTREDC